MNLKQTDNAIAKNKKKTNKQQHTPQASQLFNPF